MVYYRGLLEPVLLPDPVLLPAGPLLLPVEPVRSPPVDPLLPADPVDEFPVVPEDVRPPLPAGDAVRPAHGSADADCDGPRDPLGLPAVLLPAVDDDEPDAELRPGWLANAPLEARGPVSVAVFTGSFDEVVVPVELLRRLSGDAASATLVPEVPVAPCAPAEPDAPDRLAALFPSEVDPAVPAPAGPHGSVVVPIALDDVEPEPCVVVVVVPELPLLVPVVLCVLVVV